MNTRQLLLKLSKRFPKRIAKQNHDFVGLMEGKLPEEIKSVILCLDMDSEILDQVIALKPDLVISHHPFIYGSKCKILKSDPAKKAVYDSLEAAGIPVFSMHTNFDTGKGGMNDALAAALKLNNVYSCEKFPMMRIGELETEMDVIEFAKYAKEKFGIEYGQLIAKGNKTIKKVGIIGGGGSRYWSLAKEEGCDIYISGDAPHHVRRYIVNEKYNYLDFPHEIEKIFMPTLKNLLLSYDPNLDITIIDHEERPIII